VPEIGHSDHWLGFARLSSTSPKLTDGRLQRLQVAPCEVEFNKATKYRTSPRRLWCPGSWHPGEVLVDGQVIGGVSLGGGKGTIIGAMSGVLLIGVINNLLTLAQVPSFYVQSSTGAVIIIAAVLAAVASRNSTGIKTRT
jgi:hypothetical protein